MQESEIRAAGAAINHLLRFSSIPRKWPEQNKAYMALAQQLNEFRMPDLEYPAAPESVDELIEHARLHAEEWGRLQAEANRLGHMRKVVRAQIFLMEEGGVAERENKAEAHSGYVEHLGKLAEAETAANVMKARAQALHHRYEMWRTKSANRRQDQKL